MMFLLADDQRPDTIAALGHPDIRTPNLDALVARGLTFRRAACSYPICNVSRAEMLTGRHAWENGVDGRRGGTFKRGQTFWAEAFRDAGYRTCTVGKWHVPGRPADRGFDEAAGFFAGGGGKWWKEQADWKGTPVTGYRGWVFQSADGKRKYPERGIGLRPDIDADFANAAIRFIRKAGAAEAPWFLHVNFTAPHDPLFLPPGFEKAYKAEDIKLPPNLLPRHPFDHGNLDGRDEVLLAFPRTPAAVRDLLRVYYAVIEHLDLQVGRILKALEASGQLDNTLVVYTSDHGMAVGSHGLRGKQNQYEHTFHVPFVMAGPQVPRGETSDAQIYLRDLFPTSCELLGVPVPGSVTAKSFAPVVRGEREHHHEAMFGFFRDSQRMVRADGWKYILYPQAGREQLFHVTADPHEQKDLAQDPERKEVRDALAKRLAAWRKTQGDPLLQP